MDVSSVFFCPALMDVLVDEMGSSDCCFVVKKRGEVGLVVDSNKRARAFFFLNSTPLKKKNRDS